MWMTQKNSRDCHAIKSLISSSQHYVSLKCAFFHHKNLLTSKSIKGDFELHAQLFHAWCTIDILTFCWFLHLSATGSRVHSNMTTVVEYHFCVCKIQMIDVRNHVKLIHVDTSRRGFTKGTVLCGGY